MKPSNLESLPSDQSKADSPGAGKPTSTLLLKCPACQHPLRLSRKHLGIKGNCVSCGASIMAVESSPGIVEVVNTAKDISETPLESQSKQSEESTWANPKKSKLKPETQENSKSAQSPARSTLWGFSEAISQQEDTQSEKKDSAPESTDSKSSKVAEASTVSGDAAPKAKASFFGTRQTDGASSAGKPSDQEDQSANEPLENPSGTAPASSPFLAPRNQEAEQKKEAPDRPAEKTNTPSESPFAAPFAPPEVEEPDKNSAVPKAPAPQAEPSPQTNETQSKEEPADCSAEPSPKSPFFAPPDQKDEPGKNSPPPQAETPAPASEPQSKKESADGTVKSSPKSPFFAPPDQKDEPVKSETASPPETDLSESPFAAPFSPPEEEPQQEPLASQSPPPQAEPSPPANETQSKREPADGTLETSLISPFLAPPDQKDEPVKSETASPPETDLSESPFAAPFAPPGEESGKNSPASQSPPPQAETPPPASESQSKKEPSDDPVVQPAEKDLSESPFPASPVTPEEARSKESADAQVPPPEPEPTPAPEKPPFAAPSTAEETSPAEEPTESNSEAVPSDSPFALPFELPEEKPADEAVATQSPAPLAETSPPADQSPFVAPPEVETQSDSTTGVTPLAQASPAAPEGEVSSPPPSHSPVTPPPLPHREPTAGGQPSPANAVEKTDSPAEAPSQATPQTQSPPVEQAATTASPSQQTAPSPIEGQSEEIVQLSPFGPPQPENTADPQATECVTGFGPPPEKEPDPAPATPSPEAPPAAAAAESAPAQPVDLSAGIVLKTERRKRKLGTMPTFALIVLASVGIGFFGYTMTPPAQKQKFKADLAEWLEPGAVIVKKLPFGIGEKFSKSLGPTDSDEITASDSDGPASSNDESSAVPASLSVSDKPAP